MRDDVALRKGASRGGAKGGGVARATRGGGGAARGGETGGGQAHRRWNQGRRRTALGKEKRGAAKGEWIEEGPRRLTGASVGSLGQPLGRGTGGKGRRRRPLFLGSPRLKKLWVG